MKISIAAAAFFFFSIQANACPILQSEYIANACPAAGKTYNTMVIYQPTCNAIGFQSLAHAADGKVTTYGPVNWQPVGAGVLLQNEDANYAYYAESLYDEDSLNTYNYRVEKKTGVSKFIKAEIINLIVGGNLLISQDEFTGGTTWFNLKNCSK